MEMDSSLGSWMMLFRISSAVTAVVSVMATLMLAGPLVLYAIARWRAQRAGGDPQLGLKFALHWFAASSLHLALVGATVALYALVSPGSAGKGDLYRVAFGLLVPAGIVLGIHVAALRRTTDEEVPGVRRLFLGYNTVVTGGTGFVALMLGFQVLFARGSSHGHGHLFAAMFLVFGAAWAVCGWRLMQLVLGGSDEPDAPGAGPGAVAPVADPAAPRAGALPPLGGGSFPPIDPR
jgi:hypothetical protein